MHMLKSNVMKRRSTTPVSKGLITKSIIVITAAVMVVTAPLSMMPRASADQYDDQIAALKQEMSRYQVEADRLNNEAVSLQNTVAALTNEKNALQSQIDLNQAQYEKLQSQIAKTKADIQNNQDALGDILADLYVDDSISPLEMLASSKNIGDYVDKQEYRSSVRDQLTSTIDKIKDLKQQLEKQKADLEEVLNKQKSARDALAAKEAEQQSLLSRTRNDEATYQGMIQKNQTEINKARATQAALRARTTQTGGYQLVDSGSLSAYPWNESNCPMMSWMSTGGADGNGGDRVGSPKYGCRQCASYAAWRVARATGIYYWNWGNGGNFASAAIGAGYDNYGSQPAPNTSDYVAVMWGNPGHVAYVEQVSGDGSKVLVSQYNYDYGAGYGMYSEMWLSTSFFNQYVKVK